MLVYLYMKSGTAILGKSDIKPHVNSESLSLSLSLSLSTIEETLQFSSIHFFCCITLLTMKDYILTNTGKYRPNNTFR